MNKIQRIVFTMACLLTFTGGYAWKIVDLVIEGDGGAGATFTATYNSSAVVVNETDIDANGIVTLNISLNGDGYYLKKLEYEYVMDLGGAESRWNRAPDFPGFATRGTIAINTDHALSYGGNYSFTMPASDVVIYATFAARTDISDFSLTLDGTVASKVYDGYAHVLTLKNGGTTLTINEDYTISSSTDSWTNVFSATPTVTGIGKYKGTINSTTLSITQQPLTITAQAQTITYGSSIQTEISKVNVTGLVANDALTSITLTPSTSDVTTTGTITPSGATTTKGISNYAVTYNTGALTIQAYDLSGIASVTFTQDYYNYDGSPHQPSIDNTDGSNMKVYYGNTRLTQGTDFTTSYTTTPGIYTNAPDYTTPDIYTIDITFTGNYTGSKKVNYQIRPEITLNNNNGHRWRTYYNKTYNMEVTNDFEAFTVSSITTNSVILAGPKEVIKSATPMLLYRKTGTASGIYPALIKPSDARLDNSYWTGASTYLKCHVNGGGTPTGWDLDNDDGITGGTTKIMILVDDKFVRTKSGTLAAGKCYLDVSNSPFSSRDLNIDDVITGVHSIDNGQLIIDNLYYDLTGKRVSYPKKGIYILNGKKIIFK